MSGARKVPGGSSRAGRSSRSPRSSSVLCRTPKRSPSNAVTAAAAGCRDLGLPAVKVRFFDGRTRPWAGGFVVEWKHDWTIWLRSDLSAHELVVACGHELRHLWQRAQGKATDERDAREYGEKLA